METSTNVDIDGSPAELITKNYYGIQTCHLMIEEYPDATIWGWDKDYVIADAEATLKRLHGDKDVCYSCHGVGKSDNINVRTLVVNNRVPCSECKGTGLMCDVSDQLPEKLTTLDDLEIMLAKAQERK